MNASWVQTLFATKSLDSKSSSIYSSSEYYNISLSQKRYCNMICNCFWFFVKYLGLHLSLLNLFLFFPFFPCLHSPPPCLNWSSFLLSFSVHVSRGLAVNQPKNPLPMPPVLLQKDDVAEGLGFLDYLGIFSLAAGSLAVLILACCCYLKCFKNTSTMGPL